MREVKTNSGDLANVNLLPDGQTLRIVYQNSEDIGCSFLFTDEVPREDAQLIADSFDANALVHIDKNSSWSVNFAPNMVATFKSMVAAKVPAGYALSAIITALIKNQFITYENMIGNYGDLDLINTGFIDKSYMSVFFMDFDDEVIDFISELKSSGTQILISNITNDSSLNYFLAGAVRIGVKPMLKIFSAFGYSIDRQQEASEVAMNINLEAAEYLGNIHKDSVFALAQVLGSLTDSNLSSYLIRSVSEVDPTTWPWIGEMATSIHDNNNENTARILSTDKKNADSVLETVRSLRSDFSYENDTDHTIMYLNQFSRLAIEGKQKSLLLSILLSYGIDMFEEVVNITLEDMNIKSLNRLDVIRFYALYTYRVANNDLSTPSEMLLNLFGLNYSQSKVDDLQRY